MMINPMPKPDKIHICKECQFEIERNGHSHACSRRGEERDWHEAIKDSLWGAAEQGAEDQDKLIEEFNK